MPYTEEYDALVKKLFPTIGEGSRVNTPLTGVRFHEVKIGKNCVIMNGCLMMAAGGITIEDEAQYNGGRQSGEIEGLSGCFFMFFLVFVKRMGNFNK